MRTVAWLLLIAVLGAVLWFVITGALAILISGMIAPLGSRDLFVLGAVVAVVEIIAVWIGARRRDRAV